MALPTQLRLQIVSADKSLVNEMVDEVEIPGADGYFGVLPGHTPMLAMLQVGQLWYRKGNEKFYLSVAFGVAEVMPDRVIILADIAERAEEIDVDRAQSALHRAEQNMATRDQDLERARVSLLKAISRLNVAHRARTRG